MLAALLAALLVLLPAGPARAQRDAAPRTPEGVFLDTDSAAAKALGAARDLVANRQWSDVIDLVRQVSEQHPDRVVQVDPGRYVNVATYCNMLLASLPEEGLKLHRASVDAQARRWYESAQATGDDQDLERIVKLAFHSSWGDEALLLLGDRAWERGEVSLARAFWEKLLPVVPPDPAVIPSPALYYPAPDCDLALVRARLVLASLMLGQVERGQRELEAFKRLHPRAAGTIAGRAGELAATLASFIEEAQERQSREVGGNSATFAGNVQRNQVEPRNIEVGAVKWTVPLREYRQERPPLRVEEGFGRWWGGFRPMAERPVPGPVQESLSYYPAVAQQVLYYCDETSVYAWNLFPQDKPEPAWGRDAVIFTLPGASPAKKRSGWARFSVSIDGGRLFARLGRMAPVRGAAAVQSGPESALVCLDLEREGDLSWVVRADELESGGGRWVFDGAPLADRGRVFAALRRSDPQMQLNVACFDAGSGRLLWNRKVCIGVEPFGREYEDLRNQMLSLADDSLYFNTNAGAIAALDVYDGGVKWVATYAHVEAESLEALDKRSMHGPNPCVVHDGVIYAAPYDCDRILALDAGTGIPLWDRALDGNVHQLLGVVQRRLVAAGDRLWALDAQTGRVAWNEGHDAPDAATHGRGAIAGGMVYWPRREEILVIEAATGRRRRLIDLSGHHQAAGGGNLLVAGGLLIAAQAQRLLVFGEYGALRQQLEDDVARQPASAAPRFQLACLEEASGHGEAALEHYRAALARATAEDRFDQLPLRPQIARRAARQIERQCRQALERQDFDQAVALRQEAARLAESPAARDRALLALADTFERAGRPGDALLAFQQIIELHDDQGGAARGRGDERGPPQAHWEIARLLDRHGARLYAPIERQAAQEVSKVAGAGDHLTLSRAISRYRHSQAAFQAQLQWARRCLAKVDGPAADRAYKQLLELASTPDARVQALEGLVLTARKRGFTRSEQAWQSRLSHLLTEGKGPAAGQPVAGPKADRRLDQLRPLSVGLRPAAKANAPQGAAFAPPLARLWRRALAPEEALLVPEGVSPREELALVAGRLTACISAETGATVFDLALNGSAQWAGFSGDVLAVATGSTLAAIAPDTGALLWWRSLAALQGSAQPSAAQAALVRRSMGSAAAGTPRFAVTDDRLISLGATGVVGLAPEDGRLVWSFHPAQGTLNPHWCIADGRVVVQTSDPDRLFVLNAISGRLEATNESGGSAWIRDPVADPAGRMICVSAASRPQWLDLGTAEVLGSYGGPVSFAHDQPWVLPHDLAGMILIDGNTLARYDEKSLERQYSLRIAVRPGDDPRGALALDEKRVYLAAGGILSALTLDEGRLVWQAHLGKREWNWQVTRLEGLLVAWPAAPAGPFWASVIEPQTGNLLERLNFNRASARVNARHLELANLLLVDAGAEVHAYRPATQAVR
jgi:outer membrane protein assembly factor BamB